MLNLVLGIIIGILLSFLFFATSVFLTYTKRNPAQVIQDTIQKKTARKGSIVEVPAELEARIEDIISPDKRTEEYDDDTLYV